MSEECSPLLVHELEKCILTLKQQLKLDSVKLADKKIARDQENKDLLRQHVKVASDKLDLQCSTDNLSLFRNRAQKSTSNCILAKNEIRLLEQHVHSMSMDGGISWYPRPMVNLPNSLQKKTI